MLEIYNTPINTMFNTLDIVDCFSNLTVSPSGSLNALNGLCPPKEFAVNLIIRAIANIFDYKKNENRDPINLILMDLCIRSFLRDDQQIIELMDLINLTLADNARTIQQSIQSMICDGISVSSKDVSEMRSNYCKKVREIGYLFRIIRENICSKSISKNPFFKGDQMFVILGDYIFFKEVLQRKYMYGEIEEYLFKILFLNMDHRNTAHLTYLHKLCVQHKAFSHSVKTNEPDSSKKLLILEKLLDRELDKVIASFVISRDTTNQYVEQLDQRIRQLVQQLDHSTPPEMDAYDNQNDRMDTQQIYKLVSDLTDNIIMLQLIGDHDVFMSGYHEKLKKRFFEKKTHLILEKKIAQALRFKTSPETYVAINHSINDMQGADFVNEEFRLININSTSGRYDLDEMKEFDRSKSWFDILRRPVWGELSTEHTDVYKSLCAPKKLSIYSDTFKKFYEQYFSKNYAAGSRQIDYQYDLCTVCMDIQINQSWFAVRGNFIQTSILVHCAANPNGVATDELSRLLNIPVKNLRNQINSLIVCNLIVSGKSSDEYTGKLRINENFENKSTEIIILNLSHEQPNNHKQMDRKHIAAHDIIIYLSTMPNQTIEQLNQHFDGDCMIQLKQLMDDNTVTCCEQKFNLTDDTNDLDNYEALENMIMGAPENNAVHESGIIDWTEQPIYNEAVNGDEAANGDDPMDHPTDDQNIDQPYDALYRLEECGAEFSDITDTDEQDDEQNGVDGQDEPDEPDGPDEPDEPDGPDESNGQDEPDESNGHDEQDEPDESNGQNEPDESNGQDEPDEPVGQDEPDEPDEQDESNGHDEPDESNGQDEQDESNGQDEPYMMNEQNTENVCDNPIDHLTDHQNIDHTDDPMDRFEECGADFSDITDTEEHDDEPDESDEPDTYDRPTVNNLNE